jgi:hypothetical protein
MSAKPAYGWSECEGKCFSGMCALRFDHPACCTVPHGSRKHRHYESASDAELAASGPADLAMGRWEDDGLYCWKH